MACNNRNQNPLTVPHQPSNVLPCRSNMGIGPSQCNMFQETLYGRMGASWGSSAGQLAKTTFSPLPNNAKSMAIILGQTAVDASSSRKTAIHYKRME